MKNYWFEIIGEDSEYCGEEFLVQAESLTKAYEVVDDYFYDEEVKYLGTMSDFEAEISGLDTY